MRLFALDEELNQWEAALPLTSGSARLPLLLPLAWHLRERNTGRAWLLADEIEALLPLYSGDRSIFKARLLLLRGEILFLRSEMVAAFECGQAVLQQALAAGWQRAGGRDDAPQEPQELHVDALLLLATVCTGQGHFQQRTDYLRAAAQAVAASQDAERMLVCDSLQAIAAMFEDAPRAQAEWGPRFAFDCSTLHPGMQTHVHYFRASCRAWNNEAGDSIQYWVAAFEAGCASGQLRWAILALSNTGASFNALNEHYAALEWMERALELARGTGWPASIALCLAQVGETLRLQGQLALADGFLRDALAQFGDLGKPRNYVLTLAYRAELAIDQQDFATALAFFQQLQQEAERILQADFQSQARRGQAQALLALGQPARALAVAHEALHFARKIDDVMSQIETLKVMGKIYASQQVAAHPAAASASRLAAVDDDARATAQAHATPDAGAAPEGLPLPPDCRDASPCLHYLLKAYRLAQSLADYQIGSSLPDALAREYARLGDYRQAFQVTHNANLARDQNHRLEGTRRTIAMRIAHQTANARAASEHHRQLAASAALRAEALQQSSATLQRLSEIGLQITAQLDLQQVLQALVRHAQGLMTADSVLIFLLDVEHMQLRLALGLENGVPFEMEPLDARDPSADSVRCWQGHCVIVRDYDQHDDGWNLIEGTAPVRSAMFAPLALSDQVLGVMSLQSTRPQAYDEQQQLIFRTLCAYGAIAIDNARTYSQVQQAQAQLVEQQKLVALGELVASVAQELRQPLAQCHQKVDQLQQLHQQLDQYLQAPRPPRRDELLALLERTSQLAADINGGLHACADLVKSFKQVAVDRRSVEVREYALAELCQEIVNVMQPQAMMDGHCIELLVAQQVVMRGYPATLSQVIENLILNALNHAFPARAGGVLRLSVRLNGPERVILELQDDGVGIASSDLQRIFSPFVHTRLAQGRYGLGLHVSYNLVTSLLQGQIRIESSAGAGTTVTLDLPLQVARN